LAKVFLELENTAPAPDINDVIAEQHAALLKHPKIGANFPKRNFPAHQEELDNHNAFMEKLLAD